MVVGASSVKLTEKFDRGKKWGIRGGSVKGCGFDWRMEKAALIGSKVCAYVCITAAAGSPELSFLA